MGLGGDIFPSGHTANAVVTWESWLIPASTPRARRWLSAPSAVTSLGVGLTTVYLGTHWLSDVLLGWAAGLLILLAPPWCEPLIARAETGLFTLRDAWRARRGRAVPAPAEAPVGSPVGVPVLVKQSVPVDEEAPARRALPTARPPRAPVYRAPGPHDPLERTPVTPVGSRRPPHSDRVARTTTASSARPLTGG